MLLRTAAGSPHESTVRLLLESDTSIEASHDGGATPLCVASHRHESTVRLLLESGAAVNAGKKNGCTPVYIVSPNNLNTGVPRVTCQSSDEGIWWSVPQPPLSLKHRLTFLTCEHGVEQINCLDTCYIIKSSLNWLFFRYKPMSAQYRFVCFKL